MNLVRKIEDWLLTPILPGAISNRGRAIISLDIVLAFFVPLLYLEKIYWATYLLLFLVVSSFLFISVVYELSEMQKRHKRRKWEHEHYENILRDVKEDSERLERNAPFE